VDEVSKAMIAGCLKTIRATIVADQAKSETLTGEESKRAAKFANLWRSVEQGIVELERDLDAERKALEDK
jgi:hypothetical protein